MQSELCESHLRADNNFAWAPTPSPTAAAAAAAAVAAAVAARHRR